MIETTASQTAQDAGRDPRHPARETPMITPAQLEILSTPLDQLSFPSFARTQLRKENDWRRRQTEEDQQVFEFKPLITAGDWLSQTDLHHFGRRHAPSSRTPARPWA